MLGDRLKATRKDRLMTQAQLAARSGVSQGTISLLEANKLDADKVLSGTLMRLAAALEVNPVWLKTGEGDSSLIVGSPSLSEMIDVFESLDPAKQAAILAAAKALK